MLARWLAGGAAGIVLSWTGAVQATDIVAGPMIGHVTDASARVWMQLNTSERVTVRAIDVATRQSVSAITLDVEGPAPFVCDTPLSNLEPNKNYRVEIAFDGKAVNFAEPLVVRSGPPAGEALGFTVAFGSGLDLGAEGRARVPAALAMAEVKPRAAMLLGNVGQLPKREEEFPKLRRDAFRYLCNFQHGVRVHPDLQALFRNVPTYGTWGERDFGPVDSNRHFVYAQDALIGYQKFWANPDYGTPEAPGVYYTYAIGDVEFFVLDVRFARDADSDAARKTMLGSGQMDWLKKQLKDSRATLKVIACGSPMLSDDVSGDTWGRFKAERDGFVAFLFENKIDGVVLVSGGGRWGEMMTRKADGGGKGAYPLYELTSAALTEAAGPKATITENAARVGDAASGVNFGTLEFGGGSKAKRFVTLQLHDQAGKVILEQTVFAGNLQGR